MLLAEDSGFNETGEYRIFVQRRNNPQITTPIGFGENVSATIDAFGEVDTYTFDALAGDSLYVLMAPPPDWTLFSALGPDGSLVNAKAVNGPYGAELDINSLPSSGIYVLLAEDSGFNETGEYRIFVQRRNNPQLTTPIGFGENLSATIDASVRWIRIPMMRWREIVYMC